MRARSTDDRGDRAEPLVPERRRGARVGGRDRRRLPRGDRPAALREALAGRLGHRRGRPRRRGGRRRRALARQHDPRARARPADAAPAARARRRRLLRARRCSRSRSPPSTPAAARPSCRSSAWAALPTGARRARPDRRAARAPSRSGRCSSPTPTRPARIRAELAAEAAARGFATPADARGAAHRAVVAAANDRAAFRSKKPWKLAKTSTRLTRSSDLLDWPAHGAVARPRSRPRRGRSTSGWRPSSGPTTSASSARS